ncbi:WD repeat-containing protein 44-like protein [Dinothrombium tinctorium]|uniref:WD repeat-containing protein 44 n=1 Tax=Dinothrombium tinctorium TaxID=1965070 RepID=A0A443RLI7_9ACAR|nr:WD repeat-containing protein 44-like protein [Dinothrombium tinctorium]
MSDSHPSLSDHTDDDEFFDAKSIDDDKEDVFVVAECSGSSVVVAVEQEATAEASTEKPNAGEDRSSPKKPSVAKPSITIDSCEPVSNEQAANLTKLVDDIVSIQGNLSVTEAMQTQNEERRSVSVEEMCNWSEKKKELTAEKVDDASTSSASESEILDRVTITDLETGKSVPLSRVDEFVPKCINPLNDHLLKLTSPSESTENTETLTVDHDSNTLSKSQQLKSKVKRFGHGIIKGVKSVRKEAKEPKESKEPAIPVEPKTLGFPEFETQNFFKLKVNRKKNPPDFEGLRLIQELNDCRGAIWCMKWSVCGQLLAVAGQDQLLRVYCSYKAWKYFTQLRSKASGQQVSPNSTKDRSFSGSRSNSISSTDNLSFDNLHLSRNWMEDNTLSEEGPLLLFTAYRAHTADILDISWSKNHFLLSSSMDKTVRLWHITRVECLCTFRHIDFVTTIQFHPRDDRYFLSGSLDGKIRLWNIPDKKVTLWNEVMALPVQTRGHGKGNQPASPAHGLITSSAFVQNGKFAAVGTYDGRVIFYSTDQLKPYTEIHVSGGKNLNNRGEVMLSSSGSERKRRRNNNKVTGIEGVDETKILVTTNDSRIRLYDLRDLSLTCKYKGCVNFSSQIKASVSHDNKYIVCGSENSSFYIWRLQENTTIGQRRDRNQQWESVKLFPGTHMSLQNPSTNANGSNRNMPGIVTAATFAPSPTLLDDNAKYIIAVADFSGSIKLFLKPIV